MGICKGESDIQAERAMKLIVLLFALLIGLVGCSSSSSDGNGSTTHSTGGSTPVAGSTDPSSNPLPADGRPVLRFEPADEDSQIASATNSSGQMYEVRIWKKHPKLLKVESVGLDERNKRLAIVLRTAKVINVTTDRIPNLRLATAKQVLEIAGSDPIAEQKKTQ